MCDRTLSVRQLDSALDDLVEWERFAYHLPGISSIDVKTIQKNKHDDNVQQKLALYEVWLEKYPRGTWEDIIHSLEKAKHNRLAEKLKKKHTMTKSSPKEGATEEIQVEKSVVNTLDKLQQSFVPLVMDVQQGINEAVKCGKIRVSQLVNRTEEERAFTIPQLQAVRTTNDFFNAIRPHYTFLNCHLLVCLALMLLDPIKTAANKYTRKVDALKKTTAVKHFKDTLQHYFPSLTGKSNTMIQVRIVLEDTWERADIWLVEELVKKLFDLRHPDECQWFRVVPGSVTAVFLAPKHMMMSMIVSASKRCGLMTLLGVNAISVGECVMLMRNGEIDPFNLFTSLLYDVQNEYDTTKLLLKNTTIDLNNQVIKRKKLNQTQLHINQKLSEKINMMFEMMKSEQYIKYDLIPELEREISSGHLTLESLVSCVNESIVCPIDELAKVRSVHELFQAIQPYYTFLNDHLLQQLMCSLQQLEKDVSVLLEVNRMNTKAVKQSSKLFEIIELLQNNFDDSNISSNMIKVILTLNDTWQTATMDTVEQLIQFVFNLKHPDELLWHRVRYGSVIIEFLAPKNMMMHLITNSVKQKQLMTLTGVMRLQIGNIVVHKTTQQLTLAESSNELKNLQSTKALAIYEGYMYIESHPHNATTSLKDLNDNYNFEGITISNTYLMLACMYSDSSLAKLLLECGADPNSHNDDGLTALMCASQTGNIRQMELLLSYGANIDQQRLNGYTALMMAAYTGNTRAVKLLISANADLYCTEASKDSTAMHMAVQNGHTQVVEMLLDAHVDVNICNAAKRTCLHFTAEYKDNLDTVQLLLKRNANVDVQDSLGYTPLYIAAHQGNLQIVDQLIRANADIEIAAHDQMTPLHIASQSGSTRVVKRLLQANANKNAQEKFFQTPLMCAVSANRADNTEVVKVLLEAGADSNLESISQLSAIGLASKNGNVKIVKLLLKAGANLYSHDKYGITSLHLACRGGYMDVVNVKQG